MQQDLLKPLQHNASMAYDAQRAVSQQVASFLLNMKNLKPVPAVEGVYYP